MPEKNDHLQPSPHLRDTIRKWISPELTEATCITFSDCVDILSELTHELGADASYYDYAMALNDKGYLTPYGDEWTEESVMAPLLIAWQSCLHALRQTENIPELDVHPNHPNEKAVQNVFRIVVGSMYLELPRDTSMQQVAELMYLLDVMTY